MSWEDEEIEVTSLGDTSRRFMRPDPNVEPTPLPKVKYEIATDLVGQRPPAGEDRCWCGKPATVPTRYEGCRYCGGFDCGDFAGVDWICEDCAQQS